MLLPVAVVLLPAEPAQAPANEIFAENCLSGDARREWEQRRGRPEHPGLRDRHQRRPGRTIDFKIDTTPRTTASTSIASGTTAGSGLARSARSDRRHHRDRATGVPGLDGTTDDNLVDCGNWTVSASWSVPADAASGIYIAKPTRAMTRREPHRVRRPRRRWWLRPARPDVGHDLAGLQPVRRATASTAAPGHAHKVSYNRPFTTRVARRGLALQRRVPDGPVARAQRLRRQLRQRRRLGSGRRRALEHQAFLSVGHDEYWSAEQRDQRRGRPRRRRGPRVLQRQRGLLEDAMGAEHGGAATDHRTLVIVQGGGPRVERALDCGGTSSATPPTSGQGLWREHRPRGTARRPRTPCPDRSAGAATTAIRCRAYGTASDSGATPGIAKRRQARWRGTVGYEFDSGQPAFGWYPPGRMHAVRYHDGDVASTTLSLYRAPSGALVFGAGTVQWSWGLDGSTTAVRTPRTTHPAGHGQPPLRHGRPAGDPADRPRRGGRVDRPRPPRGITSRPARRDGPGDGTCRGTATDAGGLVGRGRGVDRRRLDMGPATGTTRLDLRVQRAGGVPATVRAADDSANIGGARAQRRLQGGPAGLPVTSIFAPSVTGVQDDNDSGGRARREVPLRRAGLDHRDPLLQDRGNTGTHTGHAVVSAGGEPRDRDVRGRVRHRLAGGDLLRAGGHRADTTYVASYHAKAGRYAIGTSFAAAGVDSPPLHASGAESTGRTACTRTAPVASTRSIVRVRELPRRRPVHLVGAAGDVTPPAVTATTPAGRRHRREPRRRHHRDVQRADGPRLDRLLDRRAPGIPPETWSVPRSPTTPSRGASSSTRGPRSTAGTRYTATIRGGR